MKWANKKYCQNGILSWTPILSRFYLLSQLFPVRSFSFLSSAFIFRYVAIVVHSLPLPLTWGWRYVRRLFQLDPSGIRPFFFADGEAFSPSRFFLKVHGRFSNSGGCFKLHDRVELSYIINFTSNTLLNSLSKYPSWVAFLNFISPSDLKGG